MQTITFFDPGLVAGALHSLEPLPPAPPEMSAQSDPPVAAHELCPDVPHAAEGESGRPSQVRKVGVDEQFGSAPRRNKSRSTDKSARNRFLADDELNVKSAEIKHLIAQHDEQRKKDIVQIGIIFEDVHSRIEEGKWRRFCRSAGFTARKADQYRFVARSPLASKLQCLGIAQALLLARDPEKAKGLLGDKSIDIAAMSVKDLKAALGLTRAPKKAASAVSADYHEGFGDGHQIHAFRAWAAGVLGIRLQELAGTDLLAVAQARHEILLSKPDPDRGLLDEAMEIVAELEATRGVRTEGRSSTANPSEEVAQ